jgi:cell division protein FtsN
MTSVSLHYNLGLKNRDEKSMEEDSFNDVDFFALDLEDTDKDGVTDSKDSCQGTPEGIPVDAKGCPLDDDSDGVPNFRDDELSSPMGAFVDQKGVQLTDSLLAYQYAFYMDSTGMFNKTEIHDHNGNTMYQNLYQKEYAVEIGTFRKGLPPELMTKFLSISDISSTNLDDSTTMYTAGKFSDLLSAEQRKKELVNEGLKDAHVVYKQNGKYYNAPAYSGTAGTPLTNTSGNTNNTAGNNNNSNNANTTNNNANNNSSNTNSSSNNASNNNSSANNTNSNSNNNTNSNSSSNSNSANNAANNTASNSANNAAVNKAGVVLRVQLGAYHRKLSKSVFRDIGDLIEIRTEDGLYKYMTGSFTSFDAAAKHKVEMLLKGYQGAFITAYKDGKRVSLQEAGATPAKKEDMQDPSDTSAMNAIDKKLVVFKVQVGVFKNAPPADKQAQFEKVKGIAKESTDSGLSRYVVGSYNDYNAAVAAKNDLVKNGLPDAFIVAFYNGGYIPVQEALELLK